MTAAGIGKGAKAKNIQPPSKVGVAVDTLITLSNVVHLTTCKNVNACLLL